MNNNKKRLKKTKRYKFNRNEYLVTIYMFDLKQNTKDDIYKQKGSENSENVRYDRRIYQRIT